ncbi:MAG: GNAT family N-acetyltransferase, partial [Kangiellaceae bacterium]|nr:GNAT family N-acetyltransferase [Kangiellaceae bacterium]
MSIFTESEINIHLLDGSDYPQLASVMDVIYPDLGGAWPRATIDHLIEQFPQGQIAVFHHKQLVAAALTIRVNRESYNRPHKYQDLFSNDLASHNYAGNALYGIDLFVHPDFQQQGLGSMLYAQRKELCRELTLQSMLAGGRLSNYQFHSNQLSVEQYINHVIEKQLF